MLLMKILYLLTVPFINVRKFVINRISQGRAVERGTEGAEGWGLGRGVPSTVGVVLGKGCAPPHEIFVKFTLNSLVLQHFVRIITV